LVGQANVHAVHPEVQALIAGDMAGSDGHGCCLVRLHDLIFHSDEPYPVPEQDLLRACLDSLGFYKNWFLKKLGGGV
jgi:hypothetical protein